jgi:hypothetical protein
VGVGGAWVGGGGRGDGLFVIDDVLIDIVDISIPKGCILVPRRDGKLAAACLGRSVGLKLGIFLMTKLSSLSLHNSFLLYSF